MSRTVDNIIAYRIISMLVKPFKDTDAFKEGIIDEKGKILKKATKLTTTKEKNAYTFLHRLVFKLKQFVEKVPGGKSRLGSLAAAYYLIREAYEGQESVHILEEKYNDLMAKDISLLEEELLVEEVIEHLYWNMFNLEAKSPAQQAAIAIAKKNRKQDLKVASKVKMKKESSDWRKDLDYEGKDDSKKLFEDDMKGMSVKSGHKRPTKSGAGMTKKGVEAYRRRNPGSKLQTAVTTKPSKLKKGSKAANRRKSYCARSAGQMKKFPKAAKDPNSRLRQARRRWNC